jgi:ABC-type lipoprotein export system ATPase subunit
MAAVRAHELFHLYPAPHGDVAALRGLSLEVADGELVSVLGPSGSGKSTLLGLCSGFMRPSSGSLGVLGLSVGDAGARELAELRRSAIGIVRQHYHLALPRELTVAEIVGFPLGLLGGRDAARVAELLAAAGLAGKACARPGELSGGEQQRVAVCAALAKRPRLLLADEPTGELDAEAGATIVELLVALAREAGAAMLVVTHDPAVAAATDRTIHIRDGRLAAEGTSRPVLIVDEQGWLRLPRGLREDAGVRERVRAQATWGKVELLAEDAERRPAATARAGGARLAAAEKRAADLAVDRVTKSYGPERVLDGVTWSFAPERLHVVAGPSGSGKTTLLNLLAALEYPDGGAVWVAGERVDSLAPDDAAGFRQRVVGYVSQHSTLVDFLTALENVELGLALRGFERAEARRRAERCLDALGLEQLADRPAGRLSGGEQRRVAVARAFAPGPQVLLADEPTAHLDRLSGRLVIRLLREAVEATGATVVAATHDPDMIAAADASLVLGREPSAATG